jgi:hypothetical protein
MKAGLRAWGLQLLFAVGLVLLARLVGTPWPSRSGAPPATLLPPPGPTLLTAGGLDNFYTAQGTPTSTPSASSTPCPSWQIMFGPDPRGGELAAMAAPASNDIWAVGS